MDTLEEVKEIENDINSIDCVIDMLNEKMDELDTKLSVKISELNDMDMGFYYNNN